MQGHGLWPEWSRPWEDQSAPWLPCFAPVQPCGEGVPSARFDWLPLSVKHHEVFQALRPSANGTKPGLCAYNCAAAEPWWTHGVWRADHGAPLAGRTDRALLGYGTLLRAGQYEGHRQVTVPARPSRLWLVSGVRFVPHVPLAGPLCTWFPTFTTNWRRHSTRQLEEKEMASPSKTYIKEPSAWTRRIEFLHWQAQRRMKKHTGE